MGNRFVCGAARRTASHPHRCAGTAEQVEAGASCRGAGPEQDWPVALRKQNGEHSLRATRMVLFDIEQFPGKRQGA